MKQTMIVVADSTKARIFTTDSARAPLQEINTMTSPEGRLHTRDLTSDLPGSGSGGGIAGKQGYEGADPKKHLLTTFAKEVASYVEDARKANKVGNLKVVAAPEMMGELRSHLSSESLKLISVELVKNITTQSADEIAKHLAAA